MQNLCNFCHNLRAFMWRKIEPKSTFVEKKWQISALLSYLMSTLFSWHRHEQALLSILKFDPPQPSNSNPKTYFDFKGRMFKSCSTPWKPTHSPESLTFQEAAASTILALWSLCRHCDIFIRIQISQWLRTWGATWKISGYTGKFLEGLESVQTVLEVLG